MLMAGVLALGAMAGGTLLTYLFDRGSPGYARLATGTVVGLTLLAFAGFMVALPLGMTPIALLLAGALATLPIAALALPGIRADVRTDLAAGRARLGELGRRRPTGGEVFAVAYVLAVAVGVWIVADRTLFEKQDGLYIANVNNLGDLPYHIAITTSFAYGENFPPQNPVFAGVPFSYHYMSDFLAAIVAAAGASLVETMLAVNVVLGASLLALIHRWTHDLTGSTGAARLAPLLVVFSGGLGWLVLLNEARQTGTGVIATFLESSARYTIDDGLLRFGNSVTTLLIPQRGLLLGMGLAVIVFTLIWHQLRKEPGRQRVEPAMLAAGLMTGALPIIHLHTFAVVLATAFMWGVVFRQWRDGLWRRWATYVIATFVVAVPLLLWTASGSQASLATFFAVELGWEGAAEDPIWFWLANAGLFIPLIVAAYAWRSPEARLSTRLVLYTLPFIVWFVVPNVLRLAPWEWDNIKVLVYWWLGSAPVVALLLVRIWQTGLAGRVLAVALSLAVVGAGVLDVGRAIVGPEYREWDRDGVELAAFIRQSTQPDDVILTAPSFNSPVLLSGRHIVMGYPGWLWANGLEYTERERELRAIYAGAPGAADALTRHSVNYVLVGPQEIAELAPNEQFVAQLKLVAQFGEYRLYATR